MEGCVQNYLESRGYAVNTNAQRIIKICDDWYSDRSLAFHKRTTVQGMPYVLRKLGFAKRCCSDDANLCEVVEISAGNEATSKAANDVLNGSRFNTQYRRQLEKTAANGTAACYVRLDNAAIYSDGSVRGGDIKLNYVDADSFIPLTLDNDVVTEAAFSSTTLVKGKKKTTLVMFVKNDRGLYTSETRFFDEYGTEIKGEERLLTLGDVKPFGVMRTAAVNNLDNMEGYGLPKIWIAIPELEVIELIYNVLAGDMDKADKLLLINEALCKFDGSGNPITPNEQIKKIFVMLGEKLPEANSLISEYNPKLRIDEVTKAFELALSLLSMMFGYGTKKYTFENGQITTATEYVGERQDQMQELNRQRQEAKEYITDIVRAVLWFENQFHGEHYDINTEVTIDFDDSYVTDKNTELERKRNDALSFDIPQLTVWYLMDAYALSEEEAAAMIEAREEAGSEDDDTQDME